MSEISIDGNSHSVAAELSDHLSLSDTTLPSSLSEEQVKNLVLGYLEALKRAADNEIVRIDKTKASIEGKLSEDRSIAVGPTLEGPVAVEPTLEGPVAVEPTLEGPVAVEPTLEEPFAAETSSQQAIESVTEAQNKHVNRGGSRKTPGFGGLSRIRGGVLKV